MMLIPKGTDASVLIIALYESPSSEIFIPLVISTKWTNPFWRIPGGGIENEEDSIKAAHRELKEETGLIADDLYHLTTILKRSWISSHEKHKQFVYVTHVRDISTLTKKSLDGDEELTIELFSIKDIQRCLDKQAQLDNYEILSIHSGVLKMVFEKLEFGNQNKN